MEARSPKHGPPPTSGWCTSTIGSLLTRTARIEEAATAVYRAGIDGLRELIHEMIDLEAAGHTGSGAALILRAVLDSTNWEALSSALAGRYNPEAEYHIVAVTKDAEAPPMHVPVPSPFTDEQQAREAAIQAAASLGQSHEAGRLVLEVRRQPRYPQPYEVLLRLPVGHSTAKGSDRQRAS